MVSQVPSVRRKPVPRMMQFLLGGCGVKVLISGTVETLQGDSTMCATGCLLIRPVSRRTIVMSLAPLIGVQRLAAHEASPVSTPMPGWTDEELAAAGLTGPHSYRSPLYGYTVGWPDSWRLDTSPGPPPVQSNPEWGETGRDDLFLSPVDPAVEARLAFSSRPDDGRTVGDMTETPLPASGGVRLIIRERRTQVTWVDLAFAEGTSSAEQVQVNQVIALDDGALLFIWMLARPDTIEASFTTAQEIMVDGEPLFETVDWQDLADGLARWP
jgi:hypothetical protein